MDLTQQEMATLIQRLAAAMDNIASAQILFAKLGKRENARVCLSRARGELQKALAKLES